MMFTNEHSAARVRKSRESIFNASTGGADEDDLEPPDIEDDAQPWPEELMKGTKACSHLSLWIIIKAKK
jgi:hypothetical protein